MKELNTLQNELLKMLWKRSNIDYHMIYFTEFRWYIEAVLKNDYTVSLEIINNWIVQLLSLGYVETPPNTYENLPPTIRTNLRITQKGREYLASLQPPAATNSPKREELESETLKLARNHLDCLKGKWQGVKIMTEDDHKRLIELTHLILMHEELPENIIKIPKKSTLPFEFIRKTFHNIYLENKKQPKTDIWVEFLHSIFDLNEEKRTTKNNFPTYRSSYEATKAAIILN